MINTENIKPLVIILLAFSCNSIQVKKSGDGAGKDSAIEQSGFNDSSPIPVQNTTVAEPSAYSTDTSIIADRTHYFGPPSLKEFYNKLTKTKQNFLLPDDKDTTVVFKEGTSVEFKAGSFISEKTGKEITGNIQVSVQEYYKLSDIILAKLSATSNGNLLETGGMIYISASSGSEKCILKEGETIRIGFPAIEMKEGMQLYNGEWTDDFRINWNKSNPIITEEIITAVDQVPVFPGGYSKFREYINKTVYYPKNAMADGLQGKVYIYFVIDKEGNITKAKIKSGIDPGCDRVALEAVKMMPKWIPGCLNGIPVNVSYILPVLFSLGSPAVGLDYNVDFGTVFNDTSISSAGAFQINRYFFSSSQLGWINCDRLWKDNNAARVDYIVHLGNEEECISTVVFHRFKAVMTGAQVGTMSVYENLPSGEKITLVAIKYINGKPYLAVKGTKISARTENDLEFHPVTMEMLKSEMKKIDI
ncbi:MAG: energy transducer TonB [Bacteroidetes bacterium]|nr:energy transducer TonB [Bacteroidota bacterium]